MEKLSLPYAAKVLMAQDEETLQFYNKVSGVLVSFDESYIDRAKDIGELSAYKTFTPKQMKSINEALGVIESPDDYIALPRTGDIDAREMMLDFASKIEGRDGAELLHAANALFGSRIKKFERVLERSALTDEWEKYISAHYEKIARAWAEENGIETTDELIEPDEDLMTESEMELGEEFEG